MRPTDLRPAASFTDRPHGTRLRYMSGCKCVPCRAANSRYETARARARFYGDRRGLVSAKRVRTHIEKLSAAGVGYKHIAKVAGMSPTTLWSYKTGKRTMLRAHHAKRILAVKVGHVAAGSRVPSAPTLERLRWLREEGFTNVGLARLMGLKGSGLQFLKSPTITRRVADRLEKIYREHHDAKLGPERPEVAEALIRANFPAMAHEVAA